MTQVDGGRSASDGSDHVAGLIAAGVFLIEWVVHRRRQRGYWSRERARWVSSRSCAVTRLSPFKQLLEKHQISAVDFLQIDAEGYDSETREVDRLLDNSPPIRELRAGPASELRGGVPQDDAQVWLQISRLGTRHSLYPHLAR